MNIPYGYCHCGCGNKTTLATQTNTAQGRTKGEPNRFLPGHRAPEKVLRGEKHGSWRGGERTERGYVFTHAPDHPCAVNGAYVREHILVVERAIGKLLPAGAVVHHANGNKADNRPENLVVCQDHSYHMLIERRTRALNACGHADWRKCSICKQWDAPENLYIRNGESSRHRSCHAREQMERHRARCGSHVHRDNIRRMS